MQCIYPIFQRKNSDCSVTEHSLGGVHNSRFFLVSILSDLSFLFIIHALSPQLKEPWRRDPTHVGDGQGNDGFASRRKDEI